MIDVLAQNHPNGQFSTLFHGLASEMKLGNNAWENACSRAAKLATQLGATAGALGHFVEALQAVSDSANNVNGISRDIGAALTRFCIRQRAVGQGLRAWGQSLNGQFSVDLERKCGEWRQTVAESERRHQKTCKRMKGKPRQIIENESRNAFVELLHAQRNQFIGFIDALLPIICAQLGMLEEGTHVRQVKDSMEAALNQNDPNALVQALLEDINCAPGPGPISPSVSTNRTVEEQKMWDQRVGLGLASSRAKSASQIGLFPMANGGTENGMETPMENGIGTYSQLYGTFVQNTSNGTVGHRNSMPPPATNDGRPSSQQQQHFWTPPYPHSNQFPSSSSSAAFPIQNGSNNFGQFDNRPKSIPNGPSTTPLVANVRHHRPPLPDAFIHSSSTQNAANSSIKSAQNSPTKLQQKRQRPFEMDAFNSSTAIQFRPIGAFSSASPHSHSALATNSSNCSIQTLDSASISIHSAEIQPKIERLPPTNIGQQIGGIGNQSQRPLSLGAAMMDSVDGSATTSTSSAALIAETLQQIDRLGLELDNYCDGLEENAENSNIKNGQRKETIMGMRHLPQPPPPPPPPLPPSIPMDPSFSISTIQNQFTSIRFRPDSLPPMANNGIGNGQCHPQKFPPPPPPLPERRNSSISSATPTAPSIAEIRSAALVRPSNNSHQQSASTPIFCAQQGMPPAIPPQPPSFRHPPTPMASSGPSIHFGQYQNYQNGK